MTDLIDSVISHICMYRFMVMKRPSNFSFKPLKPPLSSFLKPLKPLEPHPQSPLKPPLKPFKAPFNVRDIGPIPLQVNDDIVMPFSQDILTWIDTLAQARKEIAE